MPTRKQPPKSVLSQIQSVGEGAIERLANSTATRSAINSAINLKDRGEQLVTGIVAIEKRLLAVEKRLDALEKQGKGASSGAGATTSKSRTATARTGSTPAATARTASTKAASTAKPGAGAKPQS